MTDRQPAKERRAARRVRARLEALWGRGAMTSRGVIRDLSVRGCFVATAEGAREGEELRVEVGVLGVAHLPMVGRVARVVKGVGLGVRFERATPAQELALEAVIKHLLHRPSG